MRRKRRINNCSSVNILYSSNLLKKSICIRRHNHLWDRKHTAREHGALIHWKWDLRSLLVRLMNSYLSFEMQSALHICGFCIMDSTNCGPKLFEKTKFQTVPKMQNLNLPWAEHYTESTQMKWCVSIPCCSLYANIG